MSTLSIADLRRCNPGALAQLASGLRREQQRLLEVLATLLLRRVVRLAWHGPAATASAARYTVVSNQVRDLMVRLTGAASALDTAGAKLSSASLLLTRAGTHAAAEGGFVDEWGRLHLPAPTAALDPFDAAVLARRHSLLRADVETRVRGALALAREADDTLAYALGVFGRHGPVVGGTTSAVAGAVLLPPPPVAASPLGAYESAAWWTTLTPQQQRRAVLEHPEWVGPRDGVPSAARHDANLLLLARLEAQAQSKLSQIRSWGGPGSYLADDQTSRRLGELQAVRAVLARRDGGKRTLLMIDGTGDLLEVAVAVGDVDHAEHVATFVGGFTTTVGGDLGRYDTNFNHMRAQADAMGSGRLAVVTWLGYPAPQVASTLTPHESVLLGGLARGYADELAKFTNGVAASRDDPVHQSLWAHSYGAVVAGNALLRPHSVSDAVVFGSPGLPFRSVSQIGLKRGGLNVLRAKRDFVAAAGPSVHGDEAETVVGATWLSTEPQKDAVNTWRGSTGHSGYLEPGTTSAHNLLATAMFRPDLTVVATDDERTSHFSLGRAQDLAWWALSPWAPLGDRRGPMADQLRRLQAMPVR